MKREFIICKNEDKNSGKKKPTIGGGGSGIPIKK